MKIQKYILSELKNNKLSKADAVELLLDLRNSMAASIQADDGLFDAGGDDAYAAQSSESQLWPQTSYQPDWQLQCLTPKFAQLENPQHGGQTTDLPQAWQVFWCHTDVECDDHEQSIGWQKGFNSALLSTKAAQLCGGNPDKLAEKINCESLTGLGGDISDAVTLLTKQVFERVKNQLKDSAKSALMQVVIASTPSDSLLQALSGLLATAAQENPKFKGQILLVYPQVNAEQLADIVINEAYNLPPEPCTVVRYLCKPDAQPNAKAERQIRYWAPVELEPKKAQAPKKAHSTSQSSITWQNDSVYLITGGLGGLGQILVKAISEQAPKATVILTGRTDSNPAIESLKALPVTLEYLCVDVTDRSQVENLMAQIKSNYHGLNGIYHCAGFIDDGYLINKSADAVEKVLAPKVLGVVNLDQASGDFALEHFVCFSSGAVLGNPGQGDYAAANGFMDAYVHYRQNLVAKGERQGKSITFNWPLWADGGMSIDTATEETLLSQGFKALPTQVGLDALKQGLDSDLQQFLVLYQDVNHGAADTNTSTGADANQSPLADDVSSFTPQDIERLKGLTTQQLVALFAKVSKASVSKINVHEPLESYGLDSIMITSLNRLLKPMFGELSKTLLYEYDTLSALSDYLIDEHLTACAKWSGFTGQNAAINKPAQMANAGHAQANKLALKQRLKQRTANRQLALAGSQARLSVQQTVQDTIAIIGLVGRYPGAVDIDQYWQMLKTGTDCIGDIPSDRWAIEGFFEPDVNKAISERKSYSKSGGFIDGFAEFDPLFFGISPREAVNMDPQERLFLSYSWQVLEDAGYTRERLHRQHQGRVGVFVGITKTGYSLYGPSIWANGEDDFPRTSFSSVANRVSYLMNFSGPSMPIDTMCSASLTAIHEACEYLKRGDCEVAIAGGVNLYLHPANYTELCSQRMLSVDGKCKSFGAGSNGFVPGEGVGVVLLKPRLKAENDGDHIYGLIKATAINHGGKTNGYTVPSPNAQAALIADAMSKANIDARMVSYIEAHGTGTELGDPIEISGLTKAFKQSLQALQVNSSDLSCAIGSVKSNIGHLESAAGIAGVTKILLQMKHQQLAPSLHVDQINPNIDFERTPFKVQQALSPWQAPTINIDGKTQTIPRIAGLSSFGAGGSNAHIILQEYQQTEVSPLNDTLQNVPLVLVLSAKTKTQLLEQGQNLLSFIQQDKANGKKDAASIINTKADLANVCYTLQVGREAMQERAVTTLEDIDSLRHKLEQLLSDKQDASDWIFGSVASNKDTLAAFVEDEEFSETLDKWLQRGKYHKILDLWAKGLAFDWQSMYKSAAGLKRISLPTYPFATDTYWVNTSYAAAANSNSSIAAQNASSTGILHPLLHQNTSTNFDTRFTSHFNGDEFFFADHQINGRKVLPGTGHIEMARVAIALALGLDLGSNNGLDHHIALKDVMWLRPIVMSDKGLTVHISVEPIDDVNAAQNGDVALVAYDIYSIDDNDEEIIYSQGRGELLTGEALTGATLADGQVPQLNLAHLQQQCQAQVFNATDIYQIFTHVGFNYGVGHQGISELGTGVGDNQLPQAIGHLNCPAAGAKSFGLHPGLLDSVLQSALGISLQHNAKQQDNVINTPVKTGAPVPFALSGLRVYGQLPQNCYAWVRYSQGCTPEDAVQKLDISVCDAQGNIYAELENYSARFLDSASNANATNTSAANTHTADTLLYQPQWDLVPLDKQQAPSLQAFDHHVVCLIGNYSDKNTKVSKSTKAIEKALPQASVKLISFFASDLADSYQNAAKQLLGELKLAMNAAAAGHGQTRIQVIINHAYLSGLSGLLKTAGQENPQLSVQCIEINSTVKSVPKPADLAKIIAAEANELNAQDVRYQGQQRWVKSWQALADSDAIGAELAQPHKKPHKKSDKNSHQLCRNQGVYLISGGLGGLGLVIADEIAKQSQRDKFNATVVLTGRSELNDSTQAKLAALKALGLEVIYKIVDISDVIQVKRLMTYIKERFDKLTGIIHSAGLIADSFIANKALEQLDTVFSPKVAGLVNLDQASAQFELDYFVCFSSAAGAFGNPGQGDYAAANGFMDAYANHSYNQNYNSQGNRISTINWPLWASGGMQVDESVHGRMKLQGMEPLSTVAGVNALQQALESNCSQLAVLYGDAAVLKALMGQDIAEAQKTAEDPKTAEAQEQAPEPEAFIATSANSDTSQSSQLPARALVYFKQQLAQALKLHPDKLNPDAPLEDYGMDSILAMNLTNFLEQSFGSLSKTLFFEVQSVRALSEYFVKRHADALAKILAKDIVGSDVAQKPAQSNQPLQTHSKSAPAQTFTVNTPRRRQKRTGHNKTQTNPSSNASNASSNSVTDIAIVGVSGRYPQAANVDEFWQNLKAGRDCISEIPSERWDIDGFYDATKGTPGRSYSKWGGFIDGMTEFDPLFFNVVPRDAHFIDPQERIFIQCVYNTMEDAGYTREGIAQQLADSSANANRPSANIGVFVGVMYEEYQLYAAHAQSLGWQIGIPGNPSSIANRVSYWFNFCGPSMAIDTMCSSSLTAIHLAVQHIQKGSCDAAIAGGVNLTLHKNKYLVLSQSQFVSSKGRCESFGEGGDGYVPGEGVGAVLLKPLEKAQQDGDQIYALVKGTALNHGGKTNGYTVPNPLAQSAVIQQALNEAQIDPRTISYIEAHGTGTSLGDPIEITGLNEAFGALVNDSNDANCAIGSVKSNVGHLEGAAGIAGITKILLQMKYQQLVPSLHSATLNPNIDFENSVFTVQRELSPWPQPTVTIDGQTKQYPRTAGISSFGAGGSNAHIILSEYQAGNDHQQIDSKASNALLVLSARTIEQVLTQAKALHDFIDEHQLSDNDLAAICYTLQVGREAMQERVAISVDSIESLQARLAEFVESEAKDLPYQWLKGSSKDHDTLLTFMEDEEFDETIEKWLVRGKYDKLLELWVKGWPFDWSRLYQHSRLPKRISLPTYPFMKGRYWLDLPAPNAETNAANSTANSALNSETASQSQERQLLHPLLHENTSTGFDTRFTSTFSGDEFFFTDHQVQGLPVLPGTAHIEMARMALIKTLDLATAQPLTISDVVWLRPVAKGESAITLHISVKPLSETQAEYDIYSFDDDGAEIIHSQGRGEVMLSTTSSESDASINIQQLSQLCCDKTYQAATVYDLFAQGGLVYGPHHRAIVALNASLGGANEHPQVFAELALSQELQQQDGYILHPGLLDSVLQSTMAMSLTNAEKSATDVGGALLPFSIGAVKVYHSLPASAYAWVRYSEGSQPQDAIQKLDIRVYDSSGKVCVDIENFCARASAAPVVHKPEAILYQPAWTLAEQVKSTQAKDQNNNWRILLAGDFSVSDQQQLQNALPMGAQCQLLTNTNTATNIAQVYAQSASQLLAQLQHYLKNEVKGLGKSQLHVQLVIQINSQTNSEANSHHRVLAGLSSLLKTVSQENPKVVGQCIRLSTSIPAPKLAKLLLADSQDLLSPEIDYQQDASTRMVKRWHEVPFASANLGQAPIWQDNGVYLITGGLGGLGFIIAAAIAKRTIGSKVVLTGRSALNDGSREKIASLEAQGLEVDHQLADVSERASVDGLMASIKQTYGRLNGIVHSAGVLKDNFIVNKSADEFSAVMAPKVAGLVNLDEASRQFELDYFVGFSSLAGAFGNAAQADYAAANGFIDNYAEYRNTLVSQGVCHGHSLSINWPLWSAGGMQVDSATLAGLEKMGQVPLSTELGVSCFEACLAQGFEQGTKQGTEQGIAQSTLSQLVVFSGYGFAIRGLMTGAPVEQAPAQVNEAKTSSLPKTKPQSKLQTEPANETVTQSDSKQFEQAALDYFIGQFAQQLDIEQDLVDEDEPLESYGLDSILATTLTSYFEHAFGPLSKTLFFEVQTLRELSEYFVQSHSETLTELLGLSGAEPAPISEVREQIVATPTQAPIQEPTQKSAAQPASSAVVNRSVAASPQVAVSPQIDISVAGLDYFKKEFAQALELDIDLVDEDEPLESYGLDSILATNLTSYFENTFGPLSKTLFFEVQTISELCEYFVESHRDTLAQLVQLDKNEQVLGDDAIGSIPMTTHATPEAINNQRRRRNMPQPAAHQPSVAVSASSIPAPIGMQADDIASEAAQSQAIEAKPTPSTVVEQDIAIIGLSGIYPMANNMDEFWFNLQSGRDCIIDIPAERWDYQIYSANDANTAGKNYCQWGAFIDGMTEFDPLFFNISPREADFMDPQERLFLQCVYHTLEDAGYTRESLSEKSKSLTSTSSARTLPANVGVFVGVLYNEYQIYSAQAQLFGWYGATAASLSTVANRVSYWCNFNGPSMAVDTMCSSSLTAIHLAVKNLKHGECDAAIAGGVNLSLHPNKYVLLRQGNFTSTKGRCESFGEGGDGYVPGEGIGAIMLKPLSKAEADRDNIYAIIKNTVVNHGGKTNGYTVPNPVAQGELIGAALQGADIDPRIVSYIESHGTGTSLGDPIEISGLTRAFTKGSKITDDHNSLGYCAVGSVKSNIGHLEGAAGIAGVTKILLQMKYKKLVPNLHSSVLNKNIDFDNSPFVVPQQLTDWQQPAITENGQTRHYPRIAGVSSFGAGGSNAHMVLQEYQPQAHYSQEYRSQAHSGVAVCILSAKSEAQLMQQVADLAKFIEHHQLTDNDLYNLCFTLQVGREAMEERLAIGVDSIEALQEKLSLLLDTKLNSKTASAKGWCRGSVTGKNNEIASLVATEEFAEMVDKWIAKAKYDNLLDFWVKGMAFDWARLYPADNLPKRISLPSYPFLKRHHWVEMPPQLDRSAMFSQTHKLNIGKILQQQSHGQTPAASVGRAANGEVNSEVNNEVNGQANEQIIVQTNEAAPAQQLHPLLHQNTSTSFDIQFTSHFDGSEFFFTDHQIQGQKVLPGTAHLEMARIALIKALALETDAALELYDVTWLRPVVIDESLGLTLHISINALDETQFGDSAEYDIYGLDEHGEELIYSQGRGRVLTQVNQDITDIKSLQSEFEQQGQSYSAQRVYDLFAQSGFVYGPQHQAITTLFTGLEQNDEQDDAQYDEQGAAFPHAFAQLLLGSFDGANGANHGVNHGANKHLAGFAMHPGLLDSVLQTTLGVSPLLATKGNNVNGANGTGGALPFAIGSMCIYRPLPAKLCAWVFYSEDCEPDDAVQKLDIQVFDDQGQMCVEFKRFSSRVVQNAKAGVTPPQPQAQSQSQTQPQQMGEKPIQALLPMWQGASKAAISKNDKHFEQVVIVSSDSNIESKTPIANTSANTHLSYGAERLAAVLPQAKRLSLSDCATAQQFTDSLGEQASTEIEHLIWLLPQNTTDGIDSDDLINAQQHGVLGGLHLIKTLLAKGYASKALHLSVISYQTLPVNQIPHYPAHASVHGFIGSVAKEYPRWQVKLLDVPMTADIALLQEGLHLHGPQSGEALAYRGGQWYQQHLMPAKLPDSSQFVAYRHRGVYVVIGGAGGLGEVWSKTIVSQYQGQVVWLGRRALDKSIQDKIDSLGALGPAPVYLQADATSAESLTRAYQTIKQRFGAIHGLVHSAIVLSDKSVMNMDTERFSGALSAKVDTCVRMAQVFGKELMDFVLFFSSLQSFSKAAGQSNYAAGCAFEDAFALRLAEVMTCSVKVINWGFWGSVGIVSDPSYVERMKQAGIGSIEPEEGMLLLEQMLNTPVSQLGAIK